ncbi:TIGR03619 family F420-dependent LLM class oxidoreductase [Nocardioides sp. CPCC 206347]|uniref:TIGR03619 family F420-dependent LLM class oxidoreductase n=1 Tax=unclassified Nocardioides TaxID=2615069 RepID=UPI00360D4C60
MKFSLSLAYTDPHEVVTLAQTAENSGFTGIAMGEHLMHPVNIESDYPYKATPDGPRSIDHNAPLLHLWATAGAILGSTTTLRFMTSVYLLLLRHPLESANGAATLSNLSGNRFSFGVGIGWMKEEYDELGIPWEGRGARFDEALNIMDRAWQGVSERHEGKNYSISAMGTNPTPSTPIPMYFGGHAAPAMKRAALRGDGWICAPRPDAVKGQIETINQMRQEAGRDDRPFEYVAMIKQPDPALIRELRGYGVDHIIVSCPWRPDVARAGDAAKVDVLADLGATLQKIVVDL